MRIHLILFAILSLSLISCNEDLTGASKDTTPLQYISFENAETDSISDSLHTIYITRGHFSADSLTLDSLSLLSGFSLYVATDDDPVDPALGDKLDAGAVIALASDADSVRIIVLNEKNIIESIWTVRWTASVKSSSSTAVSASSSSFASSASGSSSSVIAASSSGTRVVSSCSAAE